MPKLIIEDYEAHIDTCRTEEGYNVVITIPFFLCDTAEKVMCELAGQTLAILQTIPPQPDSPYRALD